MDGRAQSKSHSAILLITITAVFTALTYVFTAFINIRLPIAANGGLIHLGNVPLFIGAIIFGKRVGAVAGGVGMALFDLLSGWTLWAPFTLITVAAMGYFVGVISEKRPDFLGYVFSIIIACIIKIIGYYIAEAIIYQNLIVPVASVPGNLLQIGCAAVIVLAIIVPLKKAANKIIPEKL